MGVRFLVNASIGYIIICGVSGVFFFLFNMLYLVPFEMNFSVMFLSIQCDRLTWYEIDPSEIHILKDL